MDSDHLTQTVFNTVSNFNNSDVETSDEFLESEPSPSTCSQAPFQPLTSHFPKKFPVLSSYTDATPILFQISSDQPDPPSPITDFQLVHELENFIAL